jgi:hypothetical protein
MPTKSKAAMKPPSGESRNSKLTQHADDAYDQFVRPKLRAKDKGRYISLDINTGVFEIGNDAMTPALKMRERFPESNLFLFRAGYTTAHSMGGGETPDPKWGFK